MTRRTTSGDLGALDAAAIERVREEVRPDPRDADELHDALLTFGFLLADEIDDFFDELVASRRATRIGDLHIAAERLPELQALHTVDTNLVPPKSREKLWPREEALVELIRGRLQLVGPTTAAALADSLSIDEGEVNLALLKLESEGVVLRGTFESRAQEWCDRRLLARIHRYTLNRLRAEIEPVTAQDFTRFLFAWQHATPSSRLTGIDGLRAAVAQLDGFEIAASAWEKQILPLRVDQYAPALLDQLCFSGEIGWAKVNSGVVIGQPERLSYVGNVGQALSLSERAQRVLETLQTRGASFSRDLNDDEAIDELIDAGLITCDGFLTRRAGRWSILTPAETDVEAQAWMLIRRYGIIFRRLLTRENAAPWRELARIYRRLEARGEIRGGRFVTGVSGEQFALPDAVETMREIRRTQPDGKVIVISAADPLNLIGILTTGDRVRSIPQTRIAYRDGLAISYMEGDFLRPIAESDPEVASALAGRRVPVTSGFVGRTA
jgi:ATP-dependent Lhr-like helicase